MFKVIIKKLLDRIRGEISSEKYVESGMKIGRNFKRMQGCSFDVSHCWLIQVGDDVTVSTNVKFIAHDVSTKNALGYAMIGSISVGNNCFIGSGTIILPNVKIGNNVIVGAGSVVTKNIPDNSIFAGNPACKISNYDDFITKRQRQMEESPIYEREYTIRCNINKHKKNEMIKTLKDKVGFIR